jgi:hypothetical protein
MEEEMKQIVYNSATCLKCLDTLISRFNGDKKKCSCDNEVSVDGGLSFMRYSAKNSSLLKHFVVFTDDDFELVRVYAYKTSYSSDITPVFTTLKDMTKEQLIESKNKTTKKWWKELIEKEIIYRKENV